MIMNGEGVIVSGEGVVVSGEGVCGEGVSGEGAIVSLRSLSRERHIGSNIVSTIEHYTAIEVIEVTMKATFWYI